MNRSLFAICFLLCSVGVFAAPLETIGVVQFSTSPVVNRVFYLTTTGSSSGLTNLLSFQRPTGGPAHNASASGASTEFARTLLAQVATVSIATPMNLSLWISSDRNSTLSLTGTLLEKLPSGNSLVVANSTELKPLSAGPAVPYNFTFPIQPQPLITYPQLSTSLSISIRAKPIQKSNVTLFWGSTSAPSFAILSLSGYMALKGPPQTRDSSHQTTSFDLNSTVPNNVVYVDVSTDSAFGLNDILRVNMTIIAPDLHSVKEATNQQMTVPDPSKPDTYTGFWIYPSNATEGTYLVSVDIIDIQNSIALRYRGPANFGLSRAPFFTRAPFNYLPYIGISGAALVGGAVYYRRRKTKKSYLVPFDHFNTLTGGELDGGTVVTVEGNTGSGKSLLSEQMMFEDLKKGRPCVFVSTGDFPSNIRENMSSMGMNTSGYEQSGLLTFVDGYSSEAGQESREKFSIPSLGDLTTMNMKITSSLPTESFKGGSLYFDSLTPLASKTKPESLISFVQSVGAKVRGLGGKAFFTMGPSIDGSVQRRLEDIADCVVQMEAFEERSVRKSRLRITKLRAKRFQQGWEIYSIEEGRGIIFYSKKPRQ